MANVPTYSDTDQPGTNILEAGRYEFETIEMNPFTSRKGNACVYNVMKIQSARKVDPICTAPGFDWRWKQYLHAIGIRRKLKKGEKVFNVNTDDCLHKKGLVDIIVNKDDPENWRNEIQRYMPLDDKKAPLSGIEDEPSESKPEIKPEKETKEESQKEEATETNTDVDL
jgi:hypothetical protein